MSSISCHPYRTYIPRGATQIVIGSIPPQRFCLKPVRLYNDDVNFYYGSRSNAFWKILSEISGVPLTYSNTSHAIAQRRKLLKSMNTGISDIIEKCIHVNASASDQHLEILEYRDIGDVLKKHTAIRTILCTSEFVRKHLMKQLCVRPIKNKAKAYTFSFNGSLYALYVLYSPSPQALKGLGKNGAKIRLEQYSSYFKM